MTYLLKTTAKAVAIGLASMAASAVVLAAPTPVEFDLTGHDDFVKSLGSEVTGRQVKSADEAKAMLTKVYNEKLEQHVSSLHYEKGVTCVSCHDQQKQGGPDWMTAVTNPPMKKACGDCHETQAYVVSKTALIVNLIALLAICPTQAKDRTMVARAKWMLYVVSIRTTLMSALMQPPGRRVKTVLGSLPKPKMVMVMLT